MDDLVNYRVMLPKPNQTNGFHKQKGKEVTFLLGTDIHIGEPDTCEQRVAITPGQAGALKSWLEDLDIKLNLFVVKGAGARAGFPDADYVAEGAQIVEESKLPSLTPPDVVHALKEPTAYEATIAGAALRIGALHSGDFRPDCGLAEVLKRGNFTGIFDGSAVGGFAYKEYRFQVRPKFRVPLRSSMSVYAGWLAGEDVGDRLGRKEKVVISGGGVVGTSSANVLLEKHLDQLEEILIIEKFPERCQELRKLYQDHPVVRIEQGFDIKDEDLQDAKGLILTIFIQGSGATPKVTHTEQIRLMKRGGLVVDVAIDEGGGVAIPKDSQTDPATGKPFVTTLEDVKQAVLDLDRDLEYQADNHMPRRRPHQASIEHGKTALLYLAALLYACAAQGGPQPALKWMMDHDYIESPKTILDALVLDLKHGLAFSRLNDLTGVYRHVLKRSDEIGTFLTDNQVQSLFV